MNAFKRNKGKSGGGVGGRVAGEGGAGGDSGGSGRSGGSGDSGGSGRSGGSGDGGGSGRSGGSGDSGGSGRKVLTKAEEQVMKVVWQLGSGLLMEIVEGMPEPAPHKNTVATILKTLVDKGFVRVENIGRIHRYHPLLSKEAYSRDTLASVAKGYFDGSFTNVVSFLVDEKKLSVKDLELLLQQLKKKK